MIPLSTPIRAVRLLGISYTCPGSREAKESAGDALADPVEGGQLGLEPGPAGQPREAQSLSRRLQANLLPVLPIEREKKLSEDEEKKTNAKVVF